LGLCRISERAYSHPEDDFSNFRARCPSHFFPLEKKKPLINLFSFSFSRFDPNKETDGTSHLLGIEEKLKELGLILLPLKSSINLIQISSSVDNQFANQPTIPTLPLRTFLSHQRPHY